VAKVWCEWEGAEFDRDQFLPYMGGPLLQHLHVVDPHTNNGIGIGTGSETGPASTRPIHIESQGQGPGVWGDVAYGHGPMARPPRDE
jgi:hypothetical protein